MLGKVPRGGVIHNSAPQLWAVPAALSGPRGLHCRRQCPGRGHTHQRPFVIGQCPLPCPANLSVLLTLPCPGALPLPSPWPDLPISRPAYAPATTSPARYRAGRSKQHHHARNVKPLPPSGESEGHTPRAGGGEGGHLPVPLAFFASFWQKKEESPSLYAL